MFEKSPAIRSADKIESQVLLLNPHRTLQRGLVGLEADTSAVFDHRVERYRRIELGNRPITYVLNDPEIAEDTVTCFNAEVVEDEDGRWKAAYVSFCSAAAPADFLKELAKNKKASAFFKTLTKTNLYSIVYRLQTAKKPETRKKRMEMIIKMLERGETFH